MTPVLAPTAPEPVRSRDRALEQAHFEFRGVASAGASDALREAKQTERRRRRSAE
jgi:hypothetical protein